jgi:putative addiction module component (TIGR02574 family)
MNTTELMNEAASLTLEERARLVDSLSQTLSPVDESVAVAWLAIARRRLDDLDSGRVAAVPGDEVFEKVCRRLDINEAPTPVADRRYAEILAARVAAADRGEFACETEVARFFVEHGE